MTEDGQAHAGEKTLGWVVAYITIYIVSLDLPTVMLFDSLLLLRKAAIAMNNTDLLSNTMKVSCKDEQVRNS